jgi:hypothetical protein
VQLPTSILGVFFIYLDSVGIYIVGSHNIGMADQLLEPSSGSRNADVDWAWLRMKGLLR